MLRNTGILKYSMKKRILICSLLLILLYFLIISLKTPERTNRFIIHSNLHFSQPSTLEKLKIQHQNKISDWVFPNNSENSLFENEQTISIIDFDKQNEGILNQYNSKLELCPTIFENTNLVGHIPQGALLIEELDEKEIEQFYADIFPGGSWRPRNCHPRYKIAVIIPYRDRKSHLNRLLDFIIPILKKQLLDFRLVVAEQVGENLFNKGRLMNAAFQFSLQKFNVDCVIFHDVDMFPQDDRVPYDCPSSGPRHLGAYVSSLGYQLWYNEIVGGVLTINMHDYLQANGFSNSYWAWGGEDDDMGNRILANNYTIERPNIEYVRFSMLKHVKRKRIAPKLVYKLLSNAATRWPSDGVNETDKWNILKVNIKPLYFHLYIDVGDPPPEWKGET